MKAAGPFFPTVVQTNGNPIQQLGYYFSGSTIRRGRKLSMNWFRFLVASCIFWFASSAHADDIEGIWRRDDGARFIIPFTHGDGFPLVYIPYEGEAELRWSQWVPGMDGTQVSYTSPSDVEWFLTQSSQNPDLIRMTSHTSKFALRKIGDFDVEGPLIGMWKSSSGNLFMPFEVDGELYITTQRPNGRHFLYTGSWDDEMDGIQFNYKSAQNYVVTLGETGQTAKSVGGGRSYGWTRIYQPDPPPLESKDVSGTWKAPNGQMELVIKNGYIVYAALIMPQVTLKMDASWVKGWEGRRFVLRTKGKEIVGTFHPSHPNTLRTRSDGEEVNWERAAD
jgi:hypothetical protein